MVCEFCSAVFRPRPQVKSPRACDKVNCQAARQKANEKAWREQNHRLYDRVYHAAKRSLRLSKLKELLTAFMDALKVGSRLKGLDLRFEQIEECLSQTFLELGSRRTNKLWTS